MPIFLIVLALAVAAVLLWYRRKMMNEAAHDAAEALGRARGAVRRERQRRQSGSPLTAIDDPVVAAATLLVSIVSDGADITPQREAALRREISVIAADGKTDEAVDYGKWATAQVDDAAVVIDKLAPFLRERLDEKEKNDLLTMIRRVATAGGPPLPMLEPRMHRLRQKLGVVVN